jgi:hypothetical protein
MFGRKGKDNPNTGSKRTVEQCKTQSESQKGKHIGEKNGFYNHKHTEKQKELWSIKRKNAIVTRKTRDKIIKTSTGKARIWLYQIIDPKGNIVFDYENVSLVYICKKLGFCFKTFIKYTIYQNRDYKGWIAKRKKIS